MTLSTQTHKALDRQTGAVKNLTAGQKKKCFVSVKHKMLKESQFYIYVTRLGLYLKRRIRHDCLHEGQMTLCKNAGFMQQSIPNRKWDIPIYFTLQVSDSHQRCILATKLWRMDDAMQCYQLPTERAIYCVSSSWFILFWIHLFEHISFWVHDVIHSQFSQFIFDHTFQWRQYKNFNSRM